MQVPGGGRGGADEILSRIGVFGGLALIAVLLLGTAVTLGLADDESARPVATATTQTQTVAPPPPPVVTEPKTATEPLPVPTETTPEAEPPRPAPAAGDDCDDGIDNDGDDLVDAAQDDGCIRDNTEAPANRPGSGADDGKDLSECNDGIDNDGDGFADDEDLDCPGSSESPVRAPPQPVPIAPPPPPPPPPPVDIPE